jgi:hypothetical protein
MTYEEIINMSEQLALAGTDGLLSPIVDSTMTAEAIYPRALKFVIAKSARKNKEDFVQTLPITFATGKATLPENVISSWVDKDIVFRDYPFASHKSYPAYSLIVNTPDNHSRNIQYFSLMGKSLYFSTGLGSINGNVYISLPVIPAVPALATDTVPISDTLANDVIAKIASVLKGESTIESLIID